MSNSAEELRAKETEDRAWEPDFSEETDALLASSCELIVNESIRSPLDVLKTPETGSKGTTSLGDGDKKKPGAGPKEIIDTGNHSKVDRPEIVGNRTRDVSPIASASTTLEHASQFSTEQSAATPPSSKHRGGILSTLEGPSLEAVVPGEDKNQDTTLMGSVVSIRSKTSNTVDSGPLLGTRKDEEKDKTLFQSVFDVVTSPYVVGVVAVVVYCINGNAIITNPLPPPLQIWFFHIFGFIFFPWTKTAYLSGKKPKEGLLNNNDTDEITGDDPELGPYREEEVEQNRESVKKYAYWYFSNVLFFGLLMWGYNVIWVYAFKYWPNRAVPNSIVQSSVAFVCVYEVIFRGDSVKRLLGGLACLLGSCLVAFSAGLEKDEGSDHNTTASYRGLLLAVGAAVLIAAYNIGFSYFSRHAMCKKSDDSITFSISVAFLVSVIHVFPLLPAMLLASFIFGWDELFGMSGNFTFQNTVMLLVCGTASYMINISYFYVLAGIKENGSSYLSAMMALTVPVQILIDIYNAEMNHEPRPKIPALGYVGHIIVMASVVVVSTVKKENKKNNYEKIELSPRARRAGATTPADHDVTAESFNLDDRATSSTAGAAVENNAKAS